MHKNFEAELPQVLDDYIPVVLDEILAQSMAREGQPCNILLWDTPGYTGGNTPGYSSEYGTTQSLHYNIIITLLHHYRPFSCLVPMQWETVSEIF